ncbi:hypothetical protein K491DRAFT_339820 [Lophiostoma macrostomum CBS 122681]|uniref:Tyrosinase copper-binding domain-containing protein n=1 Tax=Lophiostoma macrostomum CBS 122681 TaxID=1314788 RepID=A0A6A6TPQ1_9PLEO|nr:hypothetical protein K491DRAFT_339820 [Lophiostoma macrostomum CBS 122681]
MATRPRELIDQDYAYNAVDAEQKHIRILRLHPGQWHADIRCSLEVVSLKDKVQYEALSYAWGDPRITKPMFLHDVRIQVTANLEAALRHLRSREIPTILWVDAICIDQRNLEEKTHQVGLMGKIYAACIRVIIWLGTPQPRQASYPKSYLPQVKRTSGRSSLKLPVSPDNDEEMNFQDPFFLVRHFAADRHFYDLPCFLPSKFSRSFKFKDTTTFKYLWQKFLDGAQTSWWERFWCVQEALLPPEATVIFGHWRIPWNMFRTAAKNQGRHMTSCCANVAMKLPGKYTYYPDLLVTDSPNTTNAAERIKRRFSDLDWMLRAYRDKDCTNPRDKIYGLLGLIDERASDGIVVDYRATVAQVFTSAMETILKESRDWGDLRSLTGSGFHSQQFLLPSWVRNFAACPDKTGMFYEAIRLEIYRIYNAAGGKKAEIKIDGHEALELKGIMVGKIRRVGCVVLHRDAKHISHVIRSWHKVAGIKIAHTLSTLQKPRQRAFWHTIAGNIVFDQGKWRVFDESDTRAFELWLHGTLTAWMRLSKPVLEEKHVKSILASIFGRAMYITERGDIGLCGSTARPGDETWILQGGNVPFLLRRRTEPNKEEPTDHHLIGECYLHGFMTGKAVAAGDVGFSTIVLK